MTDKQPASFTLLALAALFTGCWEVPDVPLPRPRPDRPAPEPLEEEESSSGCGSSGGGLCEGVPSVEADDPCCAVHQCLLDAGAGACAAYDECQALAGGAVCGDTLCDGVECSRCAEDCSATDECLSACADPCAMDCMAGCLAISPDCVGTACWVENQCEVCP